MKSILLAGAAILLFSCSGCSKTIDALANEKPHPNASKHPGFTLYTIIAGSHYTSTSAYKPIETTEMKFTVLFDSSAIYRSKEPMNQYDINKLYGFSDNDGQHHLFSARIGWRWSEGALRLFGYVYNHGVRIEKELGIIPIGTAVTCSIQIAAGNYVFTVADVAERLPRSSNTPTAKGYQLYPYFGGDEKAPHDVNIWIKNH